MKLIKTKEKVSAMDIFYAGIEEIEHYITLVYLFCMLGIFPLYYKEQYYKIGDAKFEFFWKTSIFFIFLSFVFWVIKIWIDKIYISKNRKLQENIEAKKYLLKNKNQEINKKKTVR